MKFQPMQMPNRRNAKWIFFKTFNGIAFKSHCIKSHCI